MDGETRPDDGDIDVQQLFTRGRAAGQSEAETKDQMEGRVVVHEDANRGRCRGGGKGARPRAWAANAGPYWRGSSRSSGAGLRLRGSGDDEPEHPDDEDESSADKRLRVKDVRTRAGDGAMT